MFDFDTLLAHAVATGASDVHIKSEQKPFFRISRQLTELDTEMVHAAELIECLNRILPKHLVAGFNRGQEADFSYHSTGIGRFRINAYLAQGVPVVACRHVKTQIPTFTELNLPPVLSRIASSGRGIIIVAGTTGSGKSTTLASMIDYINQNECRRIETVEDPIEYLFEDKMSIMTQREVGLDTLSFENALKHILRHDPDVIMIGEMRDQATFKTALAAAETGHLVLTTLHAGNAAVAIHRVMELVPRDEWDRTRMVLASTLQSIVCQRLIKADGGGVVPAVEIMVNTPTICKLLEQNRLETIPEAIETGMDDGMQSFNQSIHRLITQGYITEAEGMKYATNAGQLRMSLQGINLGTSRRILSR
jgi:twitching motility protein PilT